LQGRNTSLTLFNVMFCHIWYCNLLDALSHLLVWCLFWCRQKFQYCSQVFNLELVRNNSLSLNLAATQDNTLFSKLEYHWYTYLKTILITTLFFFFFYWSKTMKRKKKERKKHHVSMRKKSCLKVVVKWMYKYHFS